VIQQERKKTMQVSYQYPAGVGDCAHEHHIATFCPVQSRKPFGLRMALTGWSGFSHESITLICASIGILIIFHTVLYPPAIVID
jgi:hypothetical protein